MTYAFVPASLKPVRLASSFSGTAVSQPSSAPSAAVSMGYSLDKYAKYSTGYTVEAEPPRTPSSWWAAYRDSLKEKFNPFRGARDTETTDGKSSVSIMAYATPYYSMQIKINAARFGKGGDPDSMINLPAFNTADAYMADCITKQYKTMAAPFGVYNIQCTEGTVRGQAEDSRTMALAAQFRMNHRTSAQKFGDFTETRRHAIIAANGCTYEEKLVDAYPRAARAFVRAGSEAKGVCVRYANGSSAAETYMADSIDKQYKFRSITNGVYDVLCNDGNVKSMAEYKRVQALSARFRANQLPMLAKTALKYEAAKYARAHYGHGCDYEEALFNDYSAVSCSMRPGSARY